MFTVGKSSLLKKIANTKVCGKQCIIKYYNNNLPYELLLLHYKVHILFFSLRILSDKLPKIFLLLTIKKLIAYIFAYFNSL